jgi:hypothetical protein
MRWLEKQRHIIDFTLSSLLRRKGKNVALAVVYTVIVFVLASVMFLSHSIKREASIILQGSPEIIVQRLSAGMHSLIPEEFASGIAKIRGVTAVNGRLWGYYYEPSARANFTLLSPEDQPEEGSITAGESLPCRLPPDLFLPT